MSQFQLQYTPSNRYAKITINGEKVWIRKETIVANLKLLFVFQVAQI